MFYSGDTDTYKEPWNKVLVRFTYAGFLPLSWTADLRRDLEPMKTERTSVVVTFSVVENRHELLQILRGGSWCYLEEIWVLVVAEGKR